MPRQGPLIDFNYFVVLNALFTQSTENGECEQRVRKTEYAEK